MSKSHDCRAITLLAPRENWDKVFKNGPSKICGRQPLNTFTWSILLVSIVPWTHLQEVYLFSKFANHIHFWKRDTTICETYVTTWRWCRQQLVRCVPFSSLQQMCLLSKAGKPLQKWKCEYFCQIRMTMTSSYWYTWYTWRYEYSTLQITRVF